MGFKKVLYKEYFSKAKYRREIIYLEDNDQNSIRIMNLIWNLWLKLQFVIESTYITNAYALMKYFRTYKAKLAGKHNIIIAGMASRFYSW